MLSLVISTLVPCGGVVVEVAGSMKKGTIILYTERRVQARCWRDMRASWRAIENLVLLHHILLAMKVDYAAL